MSSLDAQQPGFVPGQVIARFSEGTSQREVVVQVSRTSPLDLSGLTNVTEELSARCDVPLRVHRLGSGYWLTFDVDRNALPDHVRSRLRPQSGIAAVTADYTPGPDVVERFVIETEADSELRRLVTRGRVQALTERAESWSADVGLHLDVAVENETLVVSVDWEKTTPALVERLDALSEIEAAQLNYRVGSSPS